MIINLAPIKKIDLDANTDYEDVILHLSITCDSLFKLNDVLKIYNLKSLGRKMLKIHDFLDEQINIIDDFESKTNDF